MKEEKKIKIIDGGVYCAKCGVFLGSLDDPFTNKHCLECFKS